MTRRDFVKSLLTIGTVGFTAPLVIAQQSIPADWHSHQCYNPRCGTIWSHGHGVALVHTCPKCGIFQNIILDGSIGKIELRSINPYPPNMVRPQPKQEIKIEKPSILERKKFSILGH